jgi:cytidylate kinase
MENLLREYMERSFREQGAEKQTSFQPVVTLSRESGCPSKLISQMLADELNKRKVLDTGPKWRFISKEVVEEAARHLELQPTDVNYLLSSGEKGFIEDIMASFSQNYVSSHRIRKTITKVVRTLAEPGNVIMVGRGSAAILQDRPNTINIRLTAPVEWRAKELSKVKNLDEKEARKCIEDIDKKRLALIELILEQKFSPFLFHATINCSKLSKEEIVGTIIGMMEAKRMI